VPTDELIGKRIQEIRIKKGMTQEALAERINISKSSISEWEACKRVPRMETLRKIAEALGVDVWEIIGLNSVDYDEPMFASPTEEVSDPNERELVNIYRDLNDIGQSALIGTARGLAANPDMKKGSKSDAETTA
jgi:transcriptional regulator with XRE-family HTH domain